MEFGEPTNRGIWIRAYTAGVNADGAVVIGPDVLPAEIPMEEDSEKENEPECPSRAQVFLDAYAPQTSEPCSCFVRANIGDSGGQAAMANRTVRRATFLQQLRRRRLKTFRGNRGGRASGSPSIRPGDLTP